MIGTSCFGVYSRADSRLAPSQWETSLQSNAVSHLLGANLESALYSVLIGHLRNRATQTERTLDTTITSLLGQNDVATSFWRNHDVLLRHVSVEARFCTCHYCTVVVTCAKICWDHIPWISNTWTCACVVGLSARPSELLVKRCPDNNGLLVGVLGQHNLEFGSASERQRFIITAFNIGWAHTQIDPGMCSKKVSRIYFREQTWPCRRFS